MNSIHLICLGVRDLPTSLQFYKDLGFQTSANKEAPIVFLNNAGTKLELFPLKRLAEDINSETPPALSGGGFPGFTLACNMKSKVEVDALFEKVRLLDVSIVKEPTPTAWGGYSGYFTDPDGYYWEVAYSADWQFDANDMLVIE